MSIIAVFDQHDVGMATSFGARAVRRLTNEHPEWVAVLEAAVAVASRSGPSDAEFAGSRVLRELESRAGHKQWIPNLRLLVSYGILEKSGESIRGGRSAYYRFVNLLATKDALEQIRGSVAAEPRPSLSFIGAGASVAGPHGVARRSADMPYEPRC